MLSWFCSWGASEGQRLALPRDQNLIKGTVVPGDVPVTDWRASVAADEALQRVGTQRHQSDMPMQ